MLLLALSRRGYVIVQSCAVLSWLRERVGGQLDGPSSYLMKSPMNQRPDDQAREDTEDFIRKHARTEKAARAARKSAGKDAEKATK